MVDGPGSVTWAHIQISQKFVGSISSGITGDSPEEIYNNLDKGLPVWVIITLIFAPASNFQTSLK